ncbi:MAG: hypothetical protein WA738_00430 [Candidatus Angelobacter sp.]
MATNPDVLNSWKEVAEYMGRGVRTVQRWERELNLPVRRPRGKSRSAVIAFKSELDRWLRASADEQLLPQPAGPRALPGAPNGHHKLRESTIVLIDHTNQLLSRSTYLCERSKQLCEQVNRTVALTAAFLGKSRRNGDCISNNIATFSKDHALAS